MITWIQQTFQHHFRVIFAVLLGITIISFIITIGAGPGIGRAQRQTVVQPFFGLNLGSEADKKKVYGDASLAVYLTAGYMPFDEARLERYAEIRYASLALADKFHIPAPTSTEIADYIKTMPAFTNEHGQFDAQKYSSFRDSLKKNPNSNEGEISRVLSDNIRVDRVQKLLNGPGFALPSEVKRELALSDTSWTLGIASLDYASFTPTITPTDAEIQKFFADNSFRYQIPPKVSLNYVEFAAAAFLNQVTVSEPEVRSFYDSNPARFPKPAAPEIKKPAIPAPAANPAADYAAVRAQVETALKLEKAQRIAAKEASDFAVQLYERKLAFGSPDLEKMVAQHSVALRELPPFAENEVPPALGTNPQIAEEAFRLNKQRFFTDALPTETGSVILFWKETIPAREPALAEVRGKVAADYVEAERRKRFLQIGNTVRTQLAARLKAGEPFDKATEAVASAQGLKAEAKLHAPFTIRQRPQDLDPAVLNTLQHLEKGEISEMTRSQNNKGILVYAADKKMPEVTESNPQYTTMRAQLAKFTAARTGQEMLYGLVQTELAKANRALR